MNSDVCINPNCKNVACRVEHRALQHEEAFGRAVESSNVVVGRRTSPDQRMTDDSMLADREVGILREIDVIRPGERVTIEEGFENLTVYNLSGVLELKEGDFSCGKLTIGAVSTKTSRLIERDSRSLPVAPNLVINGRLRELGVETVGGGIVLGSSSGLEELTIGTNCVAVEVPASVKRIVLRGSSMNGNLHVPHDGELEYLEVGNLKFEGDQLKALKDRKELVSGVHFSS